MPLILSGNVATATAAVGYNVANSCRFNPSDNAYMNIAQGTGNRRTWTFSTWVKRCNIGSSHVLINANTTDDDKIQFHSSDVFRVYFNGSAAAFLVTNRLFRDVSAWYHIVVAVDTTQGTASNRIKLYVNGVQETSFSTETYPSEDYDTFLNLSNDFRLGQESGGGEDLDGYLAETVFIDGLQLAPTSFGEFDEDSPTIWKPIDVSGLTFGTNGFYLDYEDSGDLGDDESGEGNDLTENNLAATDQSADSPTNNWCTLNGILKSMSTMALSEGNLQGATSSSHEAYFGSFFSSIGMTAGKWYAEFKATSDANQSLVGISSNLESDVLGSSATAFHFAYKGNGWGYYGYDGKIGHTNSDTWLTYGDSLTDDDIIGVALDLDNLELYFSKNGVWQNSGDPTSGASKTGGVVNEGAKALDGSGSTGTWYFCCADNSQTEVCIWQANFGNPIHSISSGNADGDGYGNFEYAVPSGYYALNTKNLGAYGG